MKKIKAVIFDLDGTLLDSLCDLHISVNAACEAHGFPAHTKDEVCSYVGNGVYKLIERAIPDGDKNEKFESTLAFFKEHYALHMYDHTGAYEGIYEALDTLLAEGYKLAVVSNKFDLAVRELCQRFFPRHIEVAIGECEAKGIKKKPAPDTVIAALKELSLTAEEAVYVGDSDVDVLTAKNSNMPCISVLWGFRSKDFLESVGASVFALTAPELVEKIKELG
ncbi:MAG: HAD-IA family hydrolase [Clostridia bacterium]|nr:HAD-IA family hydrolase [Clostridia bacterium]